MLSKIDLLNRYSKCLNLTFLNRDDLIVWINYLLPPPPPLLERDEPELELELPEDELPDDDPEELERTEDDDPLL